MYSQYMPGVPVNQYTANPYQSRLEAYGGFNNSRPEIIRVNGENGARAFRMPPNSSILLLDETAPIVWLAQTDGAGYMSVNPYSITPYQPEAPVDTRSLEQRIARLEELINEKSDTGAVKSKRTGESNTIPDE